jgi:glycosyltransferase involved in cell wall biosynthesis
LDLANFKTELSIHEARKKMELPEDKLIFGLIGRFDPHKGQVLLLEALSKIGNKDVCVCLLGEPTKEAGNEYTDLMTRTIQNFNLNERVFIRPFRKDISTFFFAVDAFVMASKAETFGMVTIESMACGTPVIASNAGGSPEILDHGKLGLLFEPLNHDSLAKKLLHFMENRDELSPEELKKEVLKYDHKNVCEMVEKELGLVGR